MSQMHGREAVPGSASLSPVSESASKAFSDALARLLSLVNDKFTIDTRILRKHEPEDLDFIHDSHRHFADMLRAVYEFDLYDHMLDEFSWYVSTLSSRGFEEGYFRRMLRAWMIAIHSSIKPPESRDLTRPLEYLCQLLHSVYSAEYVDAEPLSPDAQHFLSLLLDKKRRDAADYALGKAAGGSNLAQVYAELVLPALNQVGVLWQKNKISVADEHAATEIGRYVISRLIDSVPKERPIGVEALVACVPGEEHDVGAQVASGILEAKGWAVIYVGRSAPEEEIIKVLESERPRVAVFAIALIARLPAARDLFVKVRSGSGSTKIIAGGRAALAARKVLEAYVDAVVDGPDELHEVALRLVGKDA